MAQLGQYCFAIGLMIITSMLMFRNSKLRRDLHAKNPLKEVRDEFSKLENTPHGTIQKMEVRLYDYEREVQARIENTMILLDQLLHEAHEETDRIHKALHEMKAMRELNSLSRGSYLTSQDDAANQKAA
jgi:predicted RNase H-like nuclease (RuvC/YqgF family)